VAGFLGEVISSRRLAEAAPVKDCHTLNLIWLIFSAASADLRRNTCLWIPESDPAVAAVGGHPTRGSTLCQHQWGARCCTWRGPPPCSLPGLPAAVQHRSHSARVLGETSDDFANLIIWKCIFVTCGRGWWSWGVAGHSRRLG